MLIALTKKIDSDHSIYWIKYENEYEYIVVIKIVTITILRFLVVQVTEALSFDEIMILLSYNKPKPTLIGAK